MTVDRYTKAVLTIIAASLVWLCANGLPASAQARQTPAPPSRVIITGIEPAASATPLRVTLVEGERLPRVLVSSEEPLRVTVAGAERPIIVEQRSMPVTPR